MDLSSVAEKKAVFFHARLFPHHGASVGTDVIGQRAVGKRQGKIVFAAALFLNLQIAPDFIPDGTAGQNLDAFGKANRLFLHQRKHIFHQTGVMGASLFASLGDLIVGNKCDLRGFFALHPDPVAHASGKGQHLTKNSVFAQTFQHRLFPIPIKTKQHRLAGEDNAYQIAVQTVFVNILPGMVGVGGNAKAVAHGTAAIFGDAGKQRNF